MLSFRTVVIIFWIGCYGGGLNLLAQAKDGKVSFIHSNNELRNYP